MTDPQMPDSPVSSLLADAIGMYELTQTWVEAGFSPEQAFALLQTVINAQILGSSMRGGGE